MYIVDRYLLRQFVRTFAICFLSLTGLYVVIDLLTNLDVFVRCGRKVGAVLPVIVNYYRLKPILFFDQTSSVLALIAATFTVSWIQRHNEMTALMAAGVSRIRVLRPIIIAAIAICVLATVNREVVMPRYRTELARRPQDPSGDHAEEFRNQYDQKTGVFFTGKATFADQMRIDSPEFDLPFGLHDYGRPAHGQERLLPAGQRRPSKRLSLRRRQRAQEP